MNIIEARQILQETNKKFQIINQEYKEISLIFTILNDTTKGKLFRINNCSLLNMILSRKSKFNIDFHEWVTYLNKSVICTLSSNLRIFKFPSKTDDEKYIYEYKKKFIDNHNCIGGHSKRLCHCDIGFIRREVSQIESLTADVRNSECHLYEQIESKLLWNDYNDLINKVKECLDILSLFLEATIYGELSNLTGISYKEQAEEFVDIILLGSIKQIPFLHHAKYGTNTNGRSAFYKKLHIEHDRLLKQDPESKSSFNDHKCGIFYIN